MGYNTSEQLERTGCLCSLVINKSSNTLSTEIISWSCFSFRGSNANESIYIFCSDLDMSESVGW